MNMQYFEDAGELLELFGIDTDKPGAQDFACIADMVALMLRYDSYRCTVADLAAVQMRTRKLSPKVFWSRMKRTLRPLIEAEAETLKALGIPAPGEPGRTCPHLAHQVGEALASTIPIDADSAEIAARVARACGRAK